MAVNLNDADKLNHGFQGAGTPNQAGIGALIPLHIGTNSVAIVDVLVNANFNNYGNYSSSINTDAAGTTFSTSTRLGYRWQPAYELRGNLLVGAGVKDWDGDGRTLGGDRSQVALLFRLDCYLRTPIGD